MKQISETKFNSNNAWGFGGSIGTRAEYDNGIVKVTGTAYYRHTRPSKYTEIRVMVDDDFSVEVRGGNDRSKVCLYKTDGDSYRATFGEVKNPFDYETNYSLIKTKQL